MTKKILLALSALLLLYFSAYPQKLMNSRKSGYYNYIFKLSDEIAAELISKCHYNHNSWGYEPFNIKMNGVYKNPDKYLSNPVDSFPFDSSYNKKLDPGYYLYVSTASSEVYVALVAKYSFDASIVPNNKDLIISVNSLNKQNKIDGYTLTLNNKNIPYDTSIKAYRIKDYHKPGVLLVTCGNEKAYFFLSNYNYLPRKALRKIKNIVLLPFKIIYGVVLHPGYVISYLFHGRDRGNNYFGYIITNKPKYLPKDTVKIKAYVVNKHGKPLKKDLTMNIYGYDEQYNYKTIAKEKIKPVSKGSYTYEFVLGDSLTLDNNYYIGFLKKSLFRNYSLDNVTNSFYYEDYQLDETAYQLSTDKEEYYPKEPVTIYLSGNDANGFPLKDATVKISAEVTAVDDFSKKKTFIPTKLWEDEIPLLPEGNTHIAIPDSLIPNAALHIKLKTVFNNSNNETHEEEKIIDVINKEGYPLCSLKNDTLEIKYIIGNISTKASAVLYAYHGTDTVSIKDCPLPCKIKIDPAISSYEIKTGETKKIFDLKNESDLISASNDKTADSIKINMSNPRKLDVSYIIYKNSKEIMSGHTNGNFHWEAADKSKSTYFIKYRYIWAGTGSESDFSAILYENKMNVKLDQPDTIRPGAQSELIIKVTDYKGNPVQDANLTAYAINTQFDRNNVPNIPYMGKVKKGLKMYNDYQVTIPMKNSQHSIWKQWFRKTSLDTIPYYQMVYPEKGLGIFYDSICSSNAQFSAVLSNYGYVYTPNMVWLDNKLVYASLADNIGRYSFTGKEGWHTLKMRAWKKEYTIDSILLKKGYKLDISVSRDSANPHVLVKKMPKKYTKDELAEIKNEIAYFYSSDANNIWFWQKDHIFHIPVANYYTKFYIGPLDEQEPVKYYTGFTNGEFHFEKELLYKYDGELHTVKSFNLPVSFPKSPSYSYANFPSLLGDTALTYDEIFFQSEENEMPSLTFTDTTKRGNGTLQLKLSSGMDVREIKIIDDKNHSATTYTGSCRIFYNLNPGNYSVLFTTKPGDIFKKDSVRVAADCFTCIDISDKDMHASSNVEIYKENTDNPNYVPLKFTVVHGIASDAATNAPLPFTTIEAFNNYKMVAYTTTDKNGKYTLLLPFIDRYSYYTVTAHKNGYYSWEDYLSVYSNASYENIKDFTLYKQNYSSQNSLLDYYPAQFDYYSFNENKSSHRNFYPRSIGRRKYRYSYSPSFLGGEYSDTQSYGNVEGIYDKTSTLQSIVVADRGIISKGDIMGVTGGLYEESPNDENYGPSYSETGENSNQLFLNSKSGSLFKTPRSNFKDYAYWQNNLWTDENGTATFHVKFPDNLTQWASYVYAMNGEKQSGTDFKLTKAYNTISASLSLPRFMLQGDTANIIGKSLNYTKDSTFITTSFLLNKKQVYQKNSLLKNSIIESYPLVAIDEDSLTAQYSLITKDNYEDGEERSIPVFPVGVNESHGKFMILENDTTLHIKMNPDSGKITVFADGNYLNLMLKDIEYLNNYPYFCMEQMASKLDGLLMEKNIKEQLGKKFKDESEIHKLIKKLEKAQQSDGSYGWWEGCKPNIWMTCYVLHALFKANENGYESSALDKGTAFIKDWIGLISIDQNTTTLLSALSLLSDMKVQINYQHYLPSLNDKNLNLTDKLTIYRIMQENKISFSMNDVLNMKKETMLGNTYWGEEKLSFYDNSIMASIMAYDILKNDSTYSSYLKNIRNYFFEKKYDGGWHNTVETAKILETILPDMIKDSQKNKLSSTITINGTTVKEFPYETSVDKATIDIAKKGTSPVFFTAYQTVWNTDKKPVDKDFKVSTWFEDEGKKITQLTSGKPVKLIAEIEVSKKAEYVMIEIPIPAGCSYGENGDKRNDAEVHREYFKNKTNIFCENLSPGKYQFEIELQPRFTGSYTLNPAKAELMYFPTFFGREGIKKIKIK